MPSLTTVALTGAPDWRMAQRHVGQGGSVGDGDVVVGAHHPQGEGAAADGPGGAGEGGRALLGRDRQGVHLTVCEPAVAPVPVVAVKPVAVPLSTLVARVPPLARLLAVLFREDELGGDDRPGWRSGCAALPAGA